MTIFLGCGFAAKYREGGGNFSVPLQWMLGLRRLKQDAIWLELLPGSESSRDDRAKIDGFQRRLREHGLAGRYCLLYQRPPNDSHDLTAIECVGMSKRELLDRLAGSNTLLNLSFSIHPPLLLKFEKRIFCDLDPVEIFYWMTKMEMGQSFHHEFWTIALNVNGPNCRLPTRLAVEASFYEASGNHGSGCGSSVRAPPRGRPLQWKTFYPLVDTKLLRPQPRPRLQKFTTIGQWYWDGCVEVDGEYPDLSKRTAFEKYLGLPREFPHAWFELAMNLPPDDPDRKRLADLGWHVVDPHRVARTPAKYRRYIASVLGEFTPIKGADVAWRSGWVSDRAAAFLATGRPVITEDTGASKYLPAASGFHFVEDMADAAVAVGSVLEDWSRQSRQARRCAEAVFDSATNVRKILGL